MDLGDTCLMQFKHERLLRWLAYMKVNNTEVGDFLSVVSLIQSVPYGYFYLSHGINYCLILRKQPKRSLELNQKNLEYH